MSDSYTLITVSGIPNSLWSDHDKAKEKADELRERNGVPHTEVHTWWPVTVADGGDK